MLITLQVCTGDVTEVFPATKLQAHSGCTWLLFCQCSHQQQVRYFSHVPASTMLVTSHGYVRCALNVPAVFPAVYLGRHISTQFQLTMLMLRLGLFTVDVRVDVVVSIWLGLGLGLKLRLVFRFRLALVLGLSWG